MTKLLSVLSRRWPILLVCALVGTLAGLLSPDVSAAGDTTTWEATRVVVATPGSPAVVSAPQDALKITRGEVPEKAAELLDEDITGEKLAGDISAQFSTETSSIEITTTADSRSGANARVDAVTEAFLETANGRIQAVDLAEIDRLKAEMQLESDSLIALYALHPQLNQPDFNIGQGNPFWDEVLRQRNEIQSRVKALENEIRDLEREVSVSAPYEALGSEPATAVATGLVAVPESRAARAALLGSLGLLLAGVLTMIIERSVPRIDTREELAGLSPLPILAEIGYLPKRRRPSGPSGSLVLEGAWGEPYRRVRSALQFVQANAKLGVDWTPKSSAPAQALAGQPAVFLVTSTSPAEGKSTTAALLAMALAEIGEQTVLIGGDFRRPQVDRLVGGAASPTMQDLAVLALDRPAIDDVVQQTSFPNMYLASSGPATREVTGLIGAVKEVATEAVRREGTVVIDSSPLMAANDTIDLLPVVDYVLLVVRAGKTSVKDFLDTIATLERMESQILGVVLIGTRFEGRQSTYYYDYYSPKLTASV